MKKRLFLLLCALLTILLPCAALADDGEAQDASAAAIAVQIELPERNAKTEYRLLDGVVLTRVSLRATDTVTLRFDAPCGALLLKWYASPAPYDLRQYDDNGARLDEFRIDDGILNRLIELNEHCAALELVVSAPCALSDVIAYDASGALPADVQRWQPAPEKADLLVVIAEPGAESRFFGGALACETVENGIQTAILYLSDYGKRQRADEALSALWSMGIREYPLFAGFTCCNYDSEQMLLNDWNDKKLTAYLIEMMALLQPKAVVTHGLDGAGYPAHKLTAACVTKAAQGSACVQKLYRAGLEDGAAICTLDMSSPLNAYNGRSAAEVAQEAYALHTSQRVYKKTVETDGVFSLAYGTAGGSRAHESLFASIDTASLLHYAPASPSPTPSPTPSPVPTASAAPVPTAETALDEKRPGSAAPIISAAAGATLSLLAFLTLFPIVKRKRSKGDAICMSLIPLALGLAVCAMLYGAAKLRRRNAALTATPSPTPTSAATASPSPTPAPTLSPEPTLSPVDAFAATFYRLEGDPEEVVVSDTEHGHWAYRSDDLGVSIDRVETVNDKGKPIAYFVAEIHIKHVSQFRPGFGSIGHTGRGTSPPWRMAREAKAVLWITGDNMINSERDEKGIIIRDGKLYSAVDYEDTLALYPDMSMRIHKPNQMDADTLLCDGVENSFSFGPTLVRDGMVNPNAMYHRVRRANPRAGIGYYAPGHYLAIVVDGRQKQYSVGMTTGEFAALFAEYGCELAYNFDGGLSAGMVFMGEQLNQHAGNRIGEKNDISYQRAVPDGLMFGYSELVPSVDDPVLNDGNRS